jgi:FixJ family two-component response regulator
MRLQRESEISPRSPFFPPKQAASTDESVIAVIDDDMSVRESLRSLFRSVGLRAEAFASAPEFLTSEFPAVAGCLVLDIRLQGLSGLDLQGELTAANQQIPIVFITGHGDIPMSVRAMKAGAVDFLTKPFRDQDLLDAVKVAIELDRQRRNAERMASDIGARFASLTPREREVMRFVAAGMINKLIGAKLGLSEITVKIHRGRLMKKMAARSVVDLARMADALGLSNHMT